jgi:nucleotide-binding universal stress UspA family protein
MADSDPAVTGVRRVVSLESIVAATDLSAPARHAAERAAQLAGDAGARLELVHVISASAIEELRRWLGSGGDAAIRAADRRRAGPARRAGASRCAPAPAARSAPRCLPVNTIEEVARLADRSEADLVVTGTRGAGLLRGVVIGTTAERIAMRSRRPVLMVRQAPHEPYRKVLVPMDFSPWSAGAIALARRVAPEGKLVLMHAVEVPFEGKLRLAGVTDDVVARYRAEAQRDAIASLHELARRWISRRGATRRSRPQGLDTWQQIVQQEQEQDCDLIVVGKHGRHAIEELLLGGTTRMVIAECSADVLVSTLRDA